MKHIQSTGLLYYQMKHDKTYLQKDTRYLFIVPSIMYVVALINTKVVTTEGENIEEYKNKG